ncbi:unnamed protein product [Moneuplotes crassus]|uniref:2Fe-2S ferredoxin n=1 Tax=Euplotes crassus TaxID=5936 RepID=A0AAD1Y1B1_EUPCR|nr:unnamed protein product [Moneuplotes crassus]
MLNLFGRRLCSKAAAVPLLMPRFRMNNMTLYRHNFMLNNLAMRSMCSKADPETVKITFLNLRDNSEKVVDAKIGEHLLEIAHSNEIDLEGACEASLACSTCHIILPDEIYDDLEYPCDEEDDLLDLAYGLTLTSRLGCQVFVTKDMDGMTVKIPEASRNFYVDGHVPKPH